MTASSSTTGAGVERERRIDSLRGNLEKRVDLVVLAKVDPVNDRAQSKDSSRIGGDGWVGWNS